MITGGRRRYHSSDLVALALVAALVLVVLVAVLVLG